MTNLEILYKLEELCKSLMKQCKHKHYIYTKDCPIKRIYTEIKELEDNAIMERLDRGIK